MIYVSDLMTSRVFTLRRTDTLEDVRSLMQLAKIRHIPVTEDGDRFVGLLTHRDLLGYAVSHLAEINREEQEEIESSILVGDIMQTDVRTVAPDTLLREAAECYVRVPSWKQAVSGLEPYWNQVPNAQRYLRIPKHVLPQKLSCGIGHS